MSLQYVEPTLDAFPIGIFARAGGGGTQKSSTFGQGAGKPSLKKASKKTAKKAAKKAAKKKKK
jgi:hypothetical protein